MSEDGPALPAGLEVVRRLGSGAFGEVFLARQSAIGRLVAVKRILPHALANADNVERFRREARVLAASDIATVVRVYDFRVDDQGALLVMEYVPGETLADRIDRGPLPVSEALTALGDVAEALRHMAERDIVHRDIKPGNVFLLPDGHAKLGDFGLARALADDSSFRTAGGAPTGTPAYFPPEVSQGHSAPDARSDAYSFAVMAYETLTAARPFEAPDALALIIAHWEREPRSPADALPGMPKQAVDLLLRGLAKDPAKRPLPHELVAGLAKIEESSWPAIEVAPRPDSPRRQDDTVVRPGFVPPTLGAGPVPTLTQAPRRSRWPLILAAGAVALLAVAAAVVLPRLGSEPLAVGDVVVEVTPMTGACPEQTYDFLATLTTNGEEGELRYRWRQPDGALTQEQTVGVPSGRTTVQLGLEFSVRGSAPLEGEGELLLLAPPVDPVGAPVSYTCSAP